MDYIRAIERQQIREDIPAVKVGDHVKVHYRIVEGERTREQVFEGDVIRMSGAGARETFTVRKISFGVGVERTFPLHSPKIAKLDVTSATAWARPLASARSATSHSPAALLGRPFGGGLLVSR